MTIVRRVDIEINAPMHEDVRFLFTLACGVGLYARADHIAFEDWLPRLPAVCREDATPDTCFLFVCDFAKAYFTEEEIEAMSAQCRAHVELGHLSSITGGIMYDSERELAADHHAGRQGYAQMLISALYRLKNAMFTFTVPAINKKMGMDGASDELRDVIAAQYDRLVTPRIEHLLAMM